MVVQQRIADNYHILQAIHKYVNLVQSVISQLLTWRKESVVFSQIYSEILLKLYICLVHLFD